MTYRRKLIEVALPLEAINVASAREKSIRHGHPSTLHLWWARRPLAACRAVLFSSLVDDPDQPGLPQAYLDYLDQMPVPASHKLEWLHISLSEQRRFKLFEFIEKLVLWENTNNPEILRTARELILAATEGHPPPVLDPFCGGGSIPLEAQRLGLEAHGSDLNPVAVLITKALIEIPPKFAGQPPINPESRARMNHHVEWGGATGLAEDVRYYGKWMRDEAEKRIGHLYPKVKLPPEHGGGEATVIAWIWARTVKCPNPACGVIMPLARSFALSMKPGKKTWIEPIVDKSARKISFGIRIGDIPVDPPKISHGVKFRCLACSQVVEDHYIKSEGMNGRMNTQMMAIVAKGSHNRIYLSPNSEHEWVATQSQLNNIPDTSLPERALGFNPQIYGLVKHRDLFTPRQASALATLGDLVIEVRQQLLTDARKADSNRNVNSVETYANAVATYLTFAVDRSADFWSTLSTWSPQPKNELVSHVFTRQVLPITWDFAEANPFSESSGNFEGNLAFILKVIQMSPSNVILGQALQRDAISPIEDISRPLISTDPPYYDNVPYADLSDFFYVWMRRSLASVYPELCSTLLVPKSQELIAEPFRHGSREKAQAFFEDGLGRP
ncbi:MAG: DUF1156 domain-containing protein [Chloroflexi bacterium]|nr:DUF1156 domain-containing protein [Chloroflexota bacterium]